MKKYDPQAKKCQDAIRLKYEGEEYTVIAKTIKVPLDTIKSWFEYDGLLYDQYVCYRDQKNEKVLAAMEDILKSEHSEHIQQREHEISRINSLLDGVRKQKDKYKNNLAARWSFSIGRRRVLRLCYLVTIVSK